MKEFTNCQGQISIEEAFKENIHKPESEEFLFTDDFKKINFPVSPNEIKQINNHPIGDSDIYKMDSVEIADYSFFDQTPEKYRINLRSSTLVIQNKPDRFRRGFTTKESIVKKILDGENKPTSKNGLTAYMALTPVEYFFLIKNGDKKINSTFEPGEKFFASKSGEIKKQIKKQIKK